MKNLLELLKPEYLELLDEQEKTYPATVELFKRNLEKSSNWLQITFDDLLTINRMLKVKINVLEIDNLFEKYEQH